MVTARLRRAWRGLLGPFDQGLSSLTNFLPSLMVARTAGVDEFAQMSMMLLAVNLGLGVVRAFAGDVVLAESSDPESSGSWRDDAATSWAALSVGAVVAGVMMSTDLLVAWSGSTATAPLAIAALALVVVSVQDHLRYVAFARGRPEVACVSDGLWLAVVAVMLFAMDLGWQAVGAVWAVGAAVGWLVAAVLLRVPLRLVDPRPWFRGTSTRGRRFCVEHASLFGASTAALVLLGASSHSEELSTVRGLQLLTSPALILLSGFGMSLPAAAGAIGRAGLMPFVHRAGVALAAAGAAVCVPLVLLPDAAGRWLLGETWAPVSGVRWMAVPYVVFGAITTVFRVGVRAARAESRSMWYQVRIAPLVVLAPVLAAAFGDERAVVAAVVGTTGVSALGWYVAARRGPRPSVRLAAVT